VFAVDFIFATGVYTPGVTAPEPLLAGDILQINTGGNKFFSASTFTNQSGLVNWNADSLFMQNGAVIGNQSVWDAKSDNALVNNGGALSTFNNSGTFRKSGGLGTTSIGSIAFVNSGIIDAQTGTINFVGGNATFNAGSEFIGAGSTLVSNNASFNSAFTSSNLSLTGGTFSGGAAQINGNLNFSGGVLTGSWEVATGQSLSGRDGGNKFLSSAALTNNGTVQWQTGNSLFLQNASIFDNQGTFNMAVGMALVNNGGPLSSFVNSGTLSVAGAQAGTVGSIAFVNNGGNIDVGAGATLNFGGGNATFHSGTSFTGSGATLVTNNARFVDDFSSQNLRLVGGVFSGGDGSPASKVIVSGTVDFSGGVVSGNWELANGQSLNGVSGNNKFLSTAQFVNKGNLRWQSTDSLFLQNGAVIDNRSLYDMQTGAAIVNNGGPLSSFVNSGTLRVAAGQNSVIGSIAFVNNGGIVDVGAGGSLNFAGGNATFNAGTQFSGAGVNMVTNNATFNGSFSSSNLSLRNSIFSGSGALLNGSVEFSGGLMQGSWTVAGGATLKGVDGINKFLNAITLTNQGTIAWQTGNTLFFQNAAVFNNHGTLDLQTNSAMVFNGGPVGSFINTGLITKSGGAGTSTIGNNLGFDNQGVVDVRSGTIRLPTNFANNGTLTGTGIFETNLLTNSGHVAPGGSPGTLMLNGNFVQTATGFLDIELASNSLFDAFLVDGTAELDGTLALSCVLLCSLAPGDEFVILDSTGDLSGIFANVSVEGFGTGFQYSLIYDYSDDLVRLQVLDASGHGTVPEPQSLALVLTALGVICALARSRQRQLLLRFMQLPIRGAAVIAPPRR
jgi:hypothetical protein